MTDDERHMTRALELAVRGRGAVEPNPMVGAVVVGAGGAVVGEGYHRKYGGPHAEVFALAAAGERATGGTLYVTLEPCCHVGKTPPCADAVAAAGVDRVVVATLDPFPQVAGGGVRKLRSAGVSVDIGVCESAARHLLRAYFKLVSSGRPTVHAKWAMTLDGRIAIRTGESQWISGEASRRRAHDLRGVMDAVLVGRGTLVADDPLLTARPPGPRVPARVVVSASGKLPDRCRLLDTAADSPVIAYTSVPNDRWVAAGAEVVVLPANDGGSSVAAVLADLGRRRMTNVLVEGGAGLLGSFFDAGAVDEVHAFVAPVIVGGAGLSPVGGRGVERLLAAVRLTDVVRESLGDDVYVSGLCRPNGPGVTAGTGCSDRPRTAPG